MNSNTTRQREKGPWRPMQVRESRQVWCIRESRLASGPTNPEDAFITTIGLSVMNCNAL
jgi:hypothetical protein